MQRLIAALLIAVALINLLPVTGLFSTELLARAYGIALPDGDLAIVLRHRALLFGIVGGLLFAAALHRPLRRLAVIIGLFSMLGYVLIVLLAKGHGDEIHRVMLIDIGASIALSVAAILDARHRARD